jgi:hypothetical protein
MRWVSIERCATSIQVSVDELIQGSRERSVDPTLHLGHLLQINWR